MSEDAAPNQERSEDSLKAYNLLAQGKRNMICREYNTAVNQYQEACELLAKWYGEMGKELAEPYFRYGSALLELARAESGVFGTALPGMDDEDEDDEDEAESSEEQGEKTSDENEDGESATTKENSADESASQEGSPSAEEKDKKEDEKTDGEKKEDEKMEGETKKEADKTDDAQAGCSKDENGKVKEEEEEDESNLKLAWEVLELAKVIFLRSETKEDQLKAAECYIKLGEIGLESDTIDGAIQDFKSSLEIQLKHVEPHNRVLAETHYQLGMAYGMAGDMDNSAESYKKAAKTISAKIETLEKVVEGAAADKGKAPAAMDDPIANAQDELKELKELLPDIVGKVEEAEAEAKNAREAARRIAAEAFGLESSAQGSNPFAAFAGFSSSSSSSSAAGGASFSSQPQASSTSEASSSSVSNITHLVRKKRKQEGEDGDCGVEVKRTRSENGTGETACQGQQEQGSGDSATTTDSTTTTTDKQITPAPVAAVSGESA